MCSGKGSKMNQRILQLAEQAGATVITTHGMEHVVDGCYVIGPARLEKFAEMIVRECGVALRPMLRDMVSRGQAYDLIKQHLGVEE